MTGEEVHLDHQGRFSNLITSFSGPKGPPEAPLVGMKVKMLWITCSEYPNNPKNACTAGRYKVGDQWVYTQAQIERGKWHLWAEDGIQPSDALDDPQWLMQYAWHPPAVPLAAGLTADRRLTDIL